MFQKYHDPDLAHLGYAKLGKTQSEDQQAEVSDLIPERAKVMKAAGFTESDICAALSLTAGGLNKALGRSASRAVERNMRKAQGKGLIGRIEGTTSRMSVREQFNPAEEQPTVELKKSTVDGREPEVCLKARHLLALGVSPEEVTKVLDVTREFLRGWIGNHWNL